MTKHFWRKSSYSTAQSNCVECAKLPGLVAVRDSKNPDGGHLAITRDAWRRFTDKIKAG
jgi:hypothetical protein